MRWFGSVAELCFVDFKKVCDVQLIGDWGMGCDVRKRRDVVVD